MYVDFPPADGTVIERTDRRIVQLHKTPEGFSITVWLRQVVDVRPSPSGARATKLGGWYCSPDAGLNLTHDGGRFLRDALGTLL
jgi:hypothetical protein